MENFVSRTKKQKLDELLHTDTRFATGYYPTGGYSPPARGWWKPSDRLGVGAIILGESGNWIWLGYNYDDAVARHESIKG